MLIRYLDRKEGLQKTERVFASRFLHWLYNTPLGRMTVDLIFKHKPVSQLYGWFHKLPELEIKRCSYKGKLYAFPNEQDYIYVYYNKEIFKELRLKEPKTYEEFLRICDRTKQAGYIPIAFGNRAKWTC